MLIKSESRADTTGRQRRCNSTFRFREAHERNRYSGSKQFSVHKDGLVRACAEHREVPRADTHRLLVSDFCHAIALGNECHFG